MKKMILPVCLLAAALLSGCAEGSQQSGAANSQSTSSSASDSSGSVDSMTLLSDALGDNMEGHTLVETEEIEINGTLCRTYAYGVNSEERFLAEEHYAVSENGDIYYMDIISGGEWVLYRS